MNKFTYVWLILVEFISKIKYMKIGKFAYKMFLRKFIYSKIDDPNKKWDDDMMKALDELFEYKEG